MEISWRLDNSDTYVRLYEKIYKIVHPALSWAKVVEPGCYCLSPSLLQYAGRAGESPSVSGACKVGTKRLPFPVHSAPPCRSILQAVTL